MIEQGMTVLYVDDQIAARDFYQALLNMEPTLDVPGMTEFNLNGLVLGLMPNKGIKNLLGDEVFDSASSENPKAELYFHVSDPQDYLDRAVKLGATLILDVSPRDWGDNVGYCLDADRHVLAFAEAL